MSLIQVESRGNDYAVRRDAWGCLQIRVIVVRDVNRIYGTKFIHEDAFNRKKSVRICYLYLLHWGKNYTHKTGRTPSYIVYSNLWRFGPNGYKRGHTKYSTAVLTYVRQFTIARKKTHRNLNSF